MGGTVADTVGRLMKQLGRQRQVLSVTHLAQVASCADHHYLVSKQAQAGHTSSKVAAVDGEARVAEVARMLGGERAQGTSLAHAQELLNQATPQLRMPTGFNPSDGVYQPVSNCTVSYELLIWDKWGELVFVGTEGWNGIIKGQNAPISSYSYTIRYTYLLEGVPTTDEKSGIFTLIR